MESIFSKRLKKLRKLKGLSQTELGNIVRLSKSAISGWETEISSPNLADLKKIANVLDTSIDYLLGNTDVAIIPQLQQTLICYSDKQIKILHAAAKTGLDEDTIAMLLENLAEIRRKDAEKNQD
jgi:transcriptional regulator with XRE-family HTH domain